MWAGFRTHWTSKGGLIGPGPEVSTVLILIGGLLTVTLVLHLRVEQRGSMLPNVLANHT
jgi:hypothetical protein